MDTAPSTLDVQAPAGPISVELFTARNPPQGSVPGVVMIHDVFGVGDDARRLAQRVADQGYVVAAPDLYARGGKRKCLLSTVRSMFTGEGTAAEDVKAVREALVGHPGCNGRTAITGFCLGGGFALIFAPKDVFDVSAPFYPSNMALGPLRGRLPQGFDELLAHSCPVVASLGRKDPFLGKNAGPVLDRALTRHGIAHDVRVYPTAGHSFVNQIPGTNGTLARFAGFGYNEEAAEDAWQRVFQFFEEHLSSS